MAAKHMVVCVQCGKQFDANRGGYYNKSSRRYTCKSCGKAHISQVRKSRAAQDAAMREEKTGMRQSMGAMIAKIGAGLLFVFAGFSTPEGGWTIGYFLTALVIGGGLIAWGLLPYLKAKGIKVHKMTTANEPVEQQTNVPKTCESCGATGTGTFCEYCGKRLN